MRQPMPVTDGPLHAVLRIIWPVLVLRIVRPGLALSAGLLCSFSALAQAPTAPDTAAAALSPIVVTATRSPEPVLALPVSIDRVDQREIQQGQLEENLSESLAGVPGASVENRQNYGGIVLGANGT